MRCLPIKLAAVLLLFLASNAGHCQLTDQATIQAAADVFFQAHLLQNINRQQHQRRWVEQYLLKLDPHRMHFLREDIKPWLRGEDSLFEKQNNMPLIRLAKIFQQRMEESSQQISQLLKADHDFSVNESVMLRHKDWPVTQKEKDDRWRLRIKYELLVEAPKQPQGNQGRAFLIQRYKRSHAHFRGLSDAKFRSLFLDAMAKAVDPHSAYMDDEYLTMFRTSFRRNFTLGMPLTFKDGDLWIRPNRRDAEWGHTSFGGWRILAVREAGKPPIHLSGLTEGTALRTIISPVGELADAKRVLLDLDNPLTGDRKLLSCTRYQPSR